MGDTPVRLLFFTLLLYAATYPKHKKMSKICRLSVDFTAVLFNM